jgi:hypothetical protein
LKHTIGNTGVFGGHNPLKIRVNPLKISYFWWYLVVENNSLKIFLTAQRNHQIIFAVLAKGEIFLQKEAKGEIRQGYCSFRMAFHQR